MNDTELEGRVAVVAGGSKGTGLATARRLRQMGAQVVTIARTAPEEGRRTPPGAPATGSVRRAPGFSLVVKRI